MTIAKDTKILLVLTYIQSIPSISKIVFKHWNILSINKAYKEFFQNEWATGFRRNIILKELIDSNKIKYNKLKNHNSII